MYVSVLMCEYSRDIEERRESSLQKQPCTLSSALAHAFLPRTAGQHVAANESKKMAAKGKLVSGFPTEIEGKADM